MNKRIHQHGYNNNSFVIVRCIVLLGHMQNNNSNDNKNNNDNSGDDYGNDDDNR